jgi:hypothetical protein
MDLDKMGMKMNDNPCEGCKDNLKTTEDILCSLSNDSRQLKCPCIICLFKTTCTETCDEFEKICSELYSEFYSELHEQKEK